MEDIRIYAKCECGNEEFKLIIRQEGSLLIQGTECVECRAYQEFVIVDGPEHKLDS